MPLTPSSARLELVNTYPDASSWILNQLSSMRLEPVPIDNCSTPNSSSQERKMPPTTSLEAITPLVKKSSISASIESESSLISALVSKVSSSSTLLVEELVQDSAPFSWKDCPLIMVRNPSSDSPCTHHPKSQLLSLSHTTQSSPLTLSSNTLMSLLCSTTRLFMISAEET